ncbi:MAG TPA: MerR family transcriptional regulator, partial [Microthrixaceae bacterium]|nr:MerR family transcriptional regulator [Microthrixaceae bacterium]
MGEDSLAQSAPEDTHGTAVVTATEPLPIGEVLALVQADFPDVTISKIRFLESQGLIQPERTASGYRRFSSTDIDRLQWILRQQRDHFLPLKVIRKMLDDGVDRYDPGGQPTLFSASV